MAKPNFSVYINGNPEEAGISSVVFGAKAPVLEVEMNEMQVIFGDKISALANMFPEGLYPQPNVEGAGAVLDVEDFKLKIKNSTLISNGYVLLINECELNLESAIRTTAQSSDKKWMYVTLSLSEEEVTGEEPLTDLSGDPIENYIIDPRIGEETSRRKKLKIDCTASNTADKEDVPSSSVDGQIKILMADFSGVVLEEGEITNPEEIPVYSYNIQEIVDAKDLESILEDEKIPVISFISIPQSRWNQDTNGIYYQRFYNDIFKAEMIPVIQGSSQVSEKKLAQYNLKIKKPRIQDGFITIYAESQPQENIQVYIICLPYKLYPVRSYSDPSLREDGFYGYDVFF